VLVFQNRKTGGLPDAKAALARRATDTHLQGMQVQDDDSELIWQEWQEALDRQAREGEPTQPSPLE
jgi:hypothetical protein